MFADGTQSIYAAHMSGDGVADILPIRNGEVCYWPELCYRSFWFRSQPISLKRINSIAILAAAQIPRMVGTDPTPSWASKCTAYGSKAVIWLPPASRTDTDFVQECGRHYSSPKSTRPRPGCGGLSRLGSTWKCRTEVELARVQKLNHLSGDTYDNCTSL